MFDPSNPIHPWHALAAMMLFLNQWAQIDEGPFGSTSLEIKMSAPGPWQAERQIASTSGIAG